MSAVAFSEVAFMGAFVEVTSMEACVEAFVEVTYMEAFVEAFVKVTSMESFVEAPVEVTSVEASTTSMEASVEACFFFAWKLPYLL